jgi:putative glycosyltransferase (TIGR04372 family)
MDHQLVRLPGRRVLLADVHRSADGHGIGYGMMLIRMRRVLLLARMLQVPVCFVASGTSLNAAVTRLESDDCVILPPESWSGRALTVLWRLSAPFRIGDPWLWVRRSVARVVVGPLYEAVERSTALPRRVRRFLVRQGPVYRRLKAINAAYAARSEALWNERYRTHVLSPLRVLEEAGQDVPTIRLRLPAEEEARVARLAESLGIQPASPIVTVHVRESGYRSTAGLRQRSWDESRNARIDSFFPAFQALVKRGYTVVRLGDPTMTPVALPGVVDLATSLARSQWLDIWCTMRSEFLIGCDSGPSWLAVLLGVPVLTVNAVHFRDVSRSTDRVVCKLARDRQTGDILSVSEMLTEDFLAVGFKGDRYACVDNTPSDIARAAIDMIEVVHGRERLSWWQKRFNQRLLDVDRAKSGGRSALEGVAIMAGARGTLSRRFAKQHFTRQETAQGHAGLTQPG